MQHGQPVVEPADDGGSASAPGSLATIVGDVERLVRLETPSSDVAAIAVAMADVARLIEERLGVEPRPVDVGGVRHLRVRFGHGTPRVVLLTHLDTVWPLGTIDRLPSGIDDGVLRGPGCFDMKAGLVMAVHAAALVAHEHGSGALDGLSILVTGDEEIGSETSRALILEEAESADAVLVLEASADGGAPKVARKGASSYRVGVTGRAAHAGLEPHRGIHAGLELAQQMLAIAALADPALGTTVTPTSFAGGTTRNTVPGAAWLDVDVRASTAAEQQRVDAALHGLAPMLPGVQLTVTGTIGRPPMEPSSSMALFDEYRRIATTLGESIPDGAHVGGASDGNFTAGAGIPTLDGLGAVGGGAHADDEHVLVDRLVPRTRVLAAFVHELLERGRVTRQAGG